MNTTPTPAEELEEFEPVDDINDSAPDDFEDDVPEHAEVIPHLEIEPVPGSLWAADFWKGAAERAIKTLFQTFVAVVIAGVGADAIGVSAGILDVSWLQALSVAGLAAILSVATSIGNADFTAGR